MKKYLLALVSLLLLLLFTGTFVVLAQDADLFGRFVPFVVDVEQAVPMVVSVPVTLDSGETLTAMVPLTVSVVLQVRVDGAGAQVVMKDAQAPVVVNISDSNATDDLGLTFDVLSGDEDISLTEWESYANESGNLAFAGKLGNLSDTERFSLVEIVMRTYRDDGSVLSIDTVSVGGRWVDPGESLRFDGRIGSDVNSIARYEMKFEAQDWQKSPNPILPQDGATSETFVEDINDPVFDGVRWSILKAEDVGQTLTLSSYTSYETAGRFVYMTMGLENTGIVSKDIRYPTGAINDYDKFYVELLDDAGRQYAPFDADVAFDDECVRTDVNPGLTSACWIAFEVAKDANNLLFRLVEREESVDKIVDIDFAFE